MVRVGLRRLGRLFGRRFLGVKPRGTAPHPNKQTAKYAKQTKPRTAPQFKPRTTRTDADPRTAPGGNHGITRKVTERG